MFVDKPLQFMRYCNCEYATFVEIYTQSKAYGITDSETSFLFHCSFST